MTCLFCRIVHRDIPSETIFLESDHAMAFLDIHPIAPGHVLVVPKKHAETIADVPDENMGALFQAVRDVEAILRKTLQPDGFTIGINQGKPWQAVDHLHVHVVPRFKDDGGGSIHGIVKNGDAVPLGEIIEKVRKATE